MKAGTKIFLGIGVSWAAALVVILTLGPSFVRQTMSKIETDLPIHREEGERAGANNDGLGCVEAVLARPRDRSAAMFSAPFGFLESCLAATPDLGAVCRELPPSAEWDQIESWARRRCSELGNQDPLCGKMFEMLMSQCHVPSAEEINTRRATNEQAGSEYGTDRTGHECLETALRLESEGRLSQRNNAAFDFFQGCFGAKTSRPQLCSGVPYFSRRNEALDWAETRCRRMYEDPEGRCRGLVADLATRLCH